MSNFAPHCEGCPNHGNDRFRFIGSAGREGAPYMIIGERGGTVEFNKGCPFVGPAGAFLNKLLKKAGIDRRDCYITNVVGCATESGVTPDKKELAACDSYIKSEIRAAKPEVLILMGGSALHPVFGTNVGIKNRHGAVEWSEEFSCWVVPTYHPSAALKEDGNSAEWEINFDLARAKQVKERGWKTEKPSVVTHDTTRDIISYLESIQDAEVLAVDIESNNLNPFIPEPKISCIAFATDTREGHVVWIKDIQEAALAGDQTARREMETITQTLKRVLESKQTLKVGANLQYDGVFIEKALGIQIVPPFFDTVIADRIIHNEAEEHGLKRTIIRETAIGHYEGDMKQYGTEENGYYDVPKDEIIPYAGIDGAGTLAVMESLAIKLIDMELTQVMQVNMALMRILMQIQVAGVSVDPSVVEMLETHYSDRAEATLKQILQIPEVQQMELDLRVEAHKKEVEKAERKYLRLKGNREKKVEPASVDLGREQDKLDGLIARSMDQDLPDAEKALLAKETKKQETAVKKAQKKYDGYLEGSDAEKRSLIAVGEAKEDLKQARALASDDEARVVFFERTPEEDAWKYFKVSSNQQLATLLFEKIKVRRGRASAKTGQHSVDKKVLSRVTHPIGQMLLDHRHDSKMVSTYLAKVRREIDWATHMVYPFFTVYGAVSGRVSSGFHTIPAHGHDAVLKAPYVSSYLGGVVVAADLGQVELRIAADISRDSRMVEGFNTGVDLHKVTAAQLFDVPVEEVTHDQRQRGKSVNFALIYATTEFGLVSRGNADNEEEGRHFISSFFKLYPGIKQYMKRAEKIVRQNRRIRSRLGNVRYLGLAWEEDENSAIRKGINYPIQCEAGVYSLICTIRIHRRLRKMGYASRILGMVHDSLILDTEPSETCDVINMVNEEFESANFGPFYPDHKLSVPLAIDIKVGSSMYMEDEAELPSDFDLTLDNIYAHIDEAEKGSILEELRQAA